MKTKSKLLNYLTSKCLKSVIFFKQNEILKKNKTMLKRTMSNHSPFSVHAHVTYKTFYVLF